VVFRKTTASSSSNEGSAAGFGGGVRRGRCGEAVITASHPLNDGGDGPRLRTFVATPFPHGGITSTLRGDGPRLRAFVAGFYPVITFML
jgi:hypothetical protein